MTESGRRQALELGRALADPSFGGARFRVIGHTDNLGAADYNQRLSERRAQVVIAFLTAECGLGAVRFEMAGRGSREPRVPGDTEAGRRRNRRVEVQVLQP